eukprot:m.923729 g.923729  ORF g.923729 m.923729 type:complete len:779 (-) comp112631_c0_seq1:127-2463(-)
MSDRPLPRSRKSSLEDDRVDTTHLPKGFTQFRQRINERYLRHGSSQSSLETHAPSPPPHAHPDHQTSPRPSTSTFIRRASSDRATIIQTGGPASFPHSGNERLGDQVNETSPPDDTLRSVHVATIGGDSDHSPRRMSARNLPPVLPKLDGASSIRGEKTPMRRLTSLPQPLILQDSSASGDGRSPPQSARDQGPILRSRSLATPVEEHHRTVRTGSKDHISSLLSKPMAPIRTDSRQGLTPRSSTSSLASDSLAEVGERDGFRDTPLAPITSRSPIDLRPAFDEVPQKTVLPLGRTASLPPQPLLRAHLENPDVSPSRVPPFTGGTVDGATRTSLPTSAPVRTGARMVVAHESLHPALASYQATSQPSLPLGEPTHSRRPGLITQASTPSILPSRAPAGSARVSARSSGTQEYHAAPQPLNSRVALPKVGSPIRAALQQALSLEMAFLKELPRDPSLYNKEKPLDCSSCCDILIDGGAFLSFGESSDSSGRCDGCRRYIMGSFSDLRKYRKSFMTKSSQSPAAPTLRSRESIGSEPDSRRTSSSTTRFAIGRDVSGGNNRAQSTRVSHSKAEIHSDTRLSASSEDFMRKAARPLQRDSQAARLLADVSTTSLTTNEDAEMFLSNTVLYDDDISRDDPRLCLSNTVVYRSQPRDIISTEDQRPLAGNSARRSLSEQSSSLKSSDTTSSPTSGSLPGTVSSALRTQAGPRFLASENDEDDDFEDEDVDVYNDPSGENDEDSDDEDHAHLLGSLNVRGTVFQGDGDDDLVYAPFSLPANPS